jgi:hypothetical protein
MFAANLGGLRAAVLWRRQDGRESWIADYMSRQLECPACWKRKGSGVRHCTDSDEWDMAIS